MDTGDCPLQTATASECRYRWLRLPATGNELRPLIHGIALLKHFAFDEPRGHLDQGIEAHARGDWAAANAQFRTFLESLFNVIALHIRAMPRSAR